MSWFEVYLWTRLDGINNFFGALIVLSSITTITFFIRSFAAPDWFYNHPSSEEENLFNSRSITYRKWAKRSFVTFLISVTACIITPSKEEAAAIYVLPKVTNSEIVKQIPEDLSEIYKLGIKEIKESIIGEEPAPQTDKKEE